MHRTGRGSFDHLVAMIEQVVKDSQRCGDLSLHSRANM